MAVIHIDRQMFSEYRMNPVSITDTATFKNDHRCADWEDICHDRNVRYWVNAYHGDTLLRYTVRSRHSLNVISRFKTLRAAVNCAEKLAQDHRWRELAEYWNRRRSTVEEF